MKLSRAEHAARVGLPGGNFTRHLVMVAKAFAAEGHREHSRKQSRCRSELSSMQDSVIEVCTDMHGQQQQSGNRLFQQFLRQYEAAE